jgi:hypothetical protein
VWPLEKMLIERLSPLLQTEANPPIACHYKLNHLSQVIHALDFAVNVWIAAYKIILPARTPFDKGWQRTNAVRLA